LYYQKLRAQFLSKAVIVSNTHSVERGAGKYPSPQITDKILANWRGFFILGVC
jgi:hypothetical protein